MASADMRKLLGCSSCQNVYSDPVMLTCGHNFCRVCIDRVLDTQRRSGGYSCPECREKFPDRPALHKNITLQNIVETYLSTQPGQEDSGVCCTYCLHAAVPAVKSCLLCDASLCDNHLTVHSKSPEHVLCDPTTSPEDRKSSLHKKILEYSSTENSEPIRVSCCLIAVHKGDPLTDGVLEKLSNILQNLKTRREEAEKRVQTLQERRRIVERNVGSEVKKVIDLFTQLRGQLEDLEKRVLGEVYKQEGQHSLHILDLIQKVETKKDELSRRIHHIEELSNMTDPLFAPLDPGDLSSELGDDEHPEQLQDAGDLDVTQITHLLGTGLSDMLIGVVGGIYIREATEILLDVNSATRSIHISDDMKTATFQGNQNRPETAEAFQFYPQVISKEAFSSGRCYWDVDVRGSHYWKVGVCYPSIQRKGGERCEGGLSGLQEIGYNDKSWVMERWNTDFFMIHDHGRFQVPTNVAGDRIRVLLDYQAGQISFYDVGEQICHLHTFTATFTEPLHAALLIWDEFGYLTICGRSQY